MATSTISNYALAVDSYADTWFADSGASEHMMDTFEWFSAFNEIPEGLHTVQIADDTKLWVRGKGDIHISCLVDNKYKQGILHDVFFVPKLKRNLFSVGLVSEGNLSFVTFPGRCEFRTLSSKIVLEGTCLRKLYQLFLKVLPPPKLMDISSSTSTYSVSNHIDGTNSSNISVVDYALATTSSKFQQDLIIWHQQMGHVNIDTIHTMSTNSSLTDFKLEKHVSLPN